MTKQNLKICMCMILGGVWPDWMANTGANVAVIRSALNHKDVKTTLTVYARANGEAELAAKQVAHQAMLQLGQVSKQKTLVPLHKKRNKTN